jgi:hypothetical protein
MQKNPKHAGKGLKKQFSSLRKISGQIIIDSRIREKRCLGKNPAAQIQTKSRHLARFRAYH